MKNNFNKDFLWGASTSAYQVEGAFNEESGKTESIMDNISKRYKDEQLLSDFSIASDHYHRWKEDVALMAELGLKAYRFSISWPRIIINEHGEINQKGIVFYHNLLDELLKHNIEPIVTIFHFDSPSFIKENGGFANRKSIDYFEYYCKVLFQNFGKKVKYWLTINELCNFYFAPDIIGLSSNIDKKELWKSIHNLNLAQAKVIILCKKMCLNSKIGPAPNVKPVYANTNKPIDNIARFNLNNFRNWGFMDVAIKGSYNKIFLKYLENNGLMFDLTQEDKKILSLAKPDFIAINYYSSSSVEFNIDKENLSKKWDQEIGFIEDNFACQVKNNQLEKTQFGWEIDPIGLRNILQEVYDRYELPIMITENGLGTYDELTDDLKIHDDYRIEYYQKHIEQLKIAIENGVELIGYMPWSAIDLVSTHSGISKRYGFIYVNRDEENLKDLNRYKKDSFYWYQQLIKNNGFEK